MGVSHQVAGFGSLQAGGKQGTSTFFSLASLPKVGRELGLEDSHSVAWHVSLNPNSPPAGALFL